MKKLFSILLGILFVWSIFLTVIFFWNKDITDEKIIVLDDALYVGITERRFKKFNGIPYDSYDYTVWAIRDVFTNKR